jgi:hypothetical protein
MIEEPWPRAERERIPASGRRERMWRAKRAKDRAEEPAPWWQTKRGFLAGFEGGMM